ncbi:CoA transferase subunit A [Desulfoferula mesophila]|uniref:CoA transferase subunit A n=1 Tax=Desulfoferula mesophila TaxID=3058419 RepID=A0AAU9EGM2_9BACT|nr:CoA transferase subunit A [Desulfoferula mesophilus]
MAKARHKVKSLSQAVGELVRPGDSVALSAALEGCIPYAAAHEIIRQGIGPLTLVAPISNISIDQMIGAGLAERVIAAWVGNVSTGIGYNYRRAVEQGLPRPLEVLDHSNFSITLALEAGGRGLPMAVGRSPMGSDMALNNPQFKSFSCPHSGQKLLAIQALNPDVALLHVQRADAQGNCQAWGASGFARQAAMASRRVLITCEEVVDSEVIRRDPDRTLVPGLLVDAVCEVPWGAHPAPVQGYYDLDNQFYLDYAAATREPAGARAWQTEWVDGLEGREAYVAKLGGERLRSLMVSHSRPSAPLEYGW